MSNHAAQLENSKLFERIKDHFMCSIIVDVEREGVYSGFAVGHMPKTKTRWKYYT